jgi:hypothetical protein
MSVSPSFNFNAELMDYRVLSPVDAQDLLGTQGILEAKDGLSFLDRELDGIRLGRNNQTSTKSTKPM